MATEVKEGRGPLSLDFTTMELPLGVLIRSHGFSWRPLMRFKLEKKGIRFEQQEWMAAHSVPRPALGRISTVPPTCPGTVSGKARDSGTSILSGWSYCSAIATGYQVGKEGKDYAAACPNQR